jgi:hypothetical protein
MAVADRLRCGALYNEAVDAYADGERALGRAWLSLAHVEVAYTKCRPLSPVRRLLCDRVLYEATNRSTFWRYRELLSEREDFLADMLALLDRLARTSGINPFMVLDDPLDRGVYAYHV